MRGACVVRIVIESPTLTLASCRGVPVDGDLILRLRTVALDEVEHAELRVGVPREAERRRALARIADRLAVRADDLRVRDLHVAFGRGHTLRALHFRQHGRGDVRTFTRAEVAAQPLRRAHDRVGVRIDVREEVVERLLDRRGEHERAGHERDAEDDRDRGQDESDLVRCQSLAGDLPHRGTTLPAGRSSAAGPLLGQVTSG